MSSETIAKSIFSIFIPIPAQNMAPKKTVLKTPSVKNFFRVEELPQPAKLARERIVTPVKTGKKAKVINNKNTTSTPKEYATLAKRRMEEFPGQSLERKQEIEAEGCMWCNACARAYSVKKSVVESHVETPRHVHRLRKYKTLETERANTALFFAQKDGRYNGDTLPLQWRVGEHGGSR